MKKITTSLLIIIMVFVLVACSGGSEEATPGTAETDTGLTEVTGENAMPIQTQLMLGTFLLEGTDLAVTSDQAPELLTLWKALQSLSTSDTAAEEEINAVIKQIQETLTPEQLDAIQDMELTQGNMATLMQELDLQPGEGFPGAGERFQGQDPPEGFPGGGFPGGGFPGGGVPGGEGRGGQGFGEGLNPEQIATMQAMREERGGLRNRVSLFLINPLLELLEGKIE